MRGGPRLKSGLLAAILACMPLAGPNAQEHVLVSIRRWFCCTAAPASSARPAGLPRARWTGPHAWPLSATWSSRSTASRHAIKARLRGQPFVEPDRIGVIGWSQGGMAVLDALNDAATLGFAGDRDRVGRLPLSRRHHRRGDALGQEDAGRPCQTRRPLSVEPLSCRRADWTAYEAAQQAFAGDAEYQQTITEIVGIARRISRELVDDIDL